MLLLLLLLLLLLSLLMLGWFSTTGCVVVPPRVTTNSFCAYYSANTEHPKCLFELKNYLSSCVGLIFCRFCLLLLLFLTLSIDLSIVCHVSMIILSFFFLLSFPIRCHTNQWVAAVDWWLLTFTSSSSSTSSYSIVDAVFTRIILTEKKREKFQLIFESMLSLV